MQKGMQFSSESYQTSKNTRGYNCSYNRSYNRSTTATE